jgi:hypothetical protein
MAKITDVHIRKLFRLLGSGTSLFQAAQKTGIDRKTARRYWTMKRLPSNQDRPERHWANSAGSVCRRLGRDRRAVERGSPLASQDALELAAEEVPGPLRGPSAPHAPTAGAHLAGHEGTGQGSVLRPGARTRPALCFGFYAPDEFAGDAWRPGIRPSGVPLRADLFQLGVGDDLLFGEFREPE